MFTAGIARKGLLFFFFIMAGLAAMGQDADSVRFVKAAWKKERIGRGARLVTHHFQNKDLFTSNQFIAYAIVKSPGRKRGFHIAADKKLLKPVSVFAKEAGALVAVNGNFFNTKEGGSVDYVKVDGRVLSGNLVNARGKMSVHQKAAVVMQNGRLAIVRGGSRPNWPDSVPAASVLANGPLLIRDAADEPVNPSPFSKNRHPRTAVGITKEGAVILLVADGRSPNAAGLSLEELRKLMRWLHCVAAINFDGGGSSTLWTKKRGVINHPSDNKKWDHEGERGVANALFYSR